MGPAGTPIEAKTEMVNSGPFSNDLEIEFRRHQRVRKVVGSQNMRSEFQGEVPINFRYFKVLNLIFGCPQ